jgi:hypothetical protein
VSDVFTGTWFRSSTYDGVVTCSMVLAIDVSSLSPL